MSFHETLQRIRDELEQGFVERSDVVEGALCALLAKQHVLFVGPPGTAKSMLADELCRRIDGARYFSWLLTRFTTPEELFGAVSLRALEQDDYRRVTDRKLPEADVAFLDEVFKANSSILNAILTLMNERRFHNGREILGVPLMTLFGATNELPEEDDLAAFYDRFLLRFVVDPIREDFRFLRMLEARPVEQRTVLCHDALEEAQSALRDVAIPSGVLRLIADIRRELGRKRIGASDRRYRQSLDALRAKAILSGRSSVDEMDLGFLEHILWRDPAERGEVRATVRGVVQGHEDEVRELLFQSRELREYAVRDWETKEMRSRALIEVETKLRQILSRVDSILTSASEDGRPVTEAQTIREEIAAIRDEMRESL